jgi:hypothetical protein
MVARRVGRLRALVAAALVVAAVAVGVGSYLGLSHTERNSTVTKFTSIVNAGVSKLDDNFQKMDQSLRLMAQMYVDHSTLADWPAVVLPNFYTSAPLAKEISEADSITFAARVKPEDVKRYEDFMFEYWDSDPNIPPDAAGYYNATGRGVWAVNQPPYHDTTGSTTWGENKRIFAISQVYNITYITYITYITFITYITYISL